MDGRLRAIEAVWFLGECCEDAKLTEYRRLVEGKRDLRARSERREEG